MLHLSVAKTGIDIPLTRSAAHPYAGRSTCSYIFEEKRQRSEEQRQCNISTREVTAFRFAMYADPILEWFSRVKESTTPKKYERLRDGFLAGGVHA